MIASVKYILNRRKKMLAPINYKKRPILSSLNVTGADGYLLVETTGLAISECYRRSIACSVTLVTAVQFCTGDGETVRVRACWRNKRQQGLLCIVKNKNKQRSDTKCLLRYTRCITQAVASNRRTPKTSFRVRARKLFLPK